MAQSILQIILKVTKEGTGDKEAAAAAKELKGSLKDLGLGALASVTPLALVATAVSSVAAFTIDATKETVKYADQVRAMMQLSGQSAEESSRLLQVMDDLKVGTDVLTMATKTLAKEGLSMNIETLSRLSDEYNKLGNGADKTAFLVKNFGKSGLQMAEAMEKGGSALRGMNAQVEAGLVLDQKAIDATRQLQREQDQLNDSWLAFKVTVGTAVIPVLNDAIQYERNWQAAQEEASKAVGLSGLEMEALAQKIFAEKQATDEAANSTDNASRAYTAMARAASGSALSTEDLAAAEKELAKTNEATLKTVESFTSVFADHNAKINAINAERKGIETQMQADLAAGWSQNSERVQGYKNKLDELGAAEQEESAKAEVAMRGKILTMLETQLAIDGLSTTEMNYLLTLGQQWGVYSAEAVAAAKAAQAEVKRLGENIINLPNGKTISLDVLISQVVDTGTGRRAVGAAQGRDSGGRGRPGQVYAIGTGAQPEYFVPDSAGTFMPNGGGGVTVNLTYAPGVSIHDQAAITDFVYTGIRKAKADGLLR